MTLRAEPVQIGQFLAAVFPYADETSWISFRAFDQFERGGKAVFIETIQVGRDAGAVARQATALAERAANYTRPVVFAPPVATFSNPRSAATIDLANGVAISVEIDKADPETGRRRLEQLLGPVTIAVHSGGEWTDEETGEILPKAHLHWRLSEPTRTPDEHAKLREARYLAAILVGADTSAAPVAHPLRWPGSWHLKNKPRLATVAAENPSSEVHLDEALEKLQLAVEAAGFGRDVPAGPKASSEPQAPLAIVSAALMAIPNPDLHWEEWNRIGMAMWRASGGSADGLQAWADWSAHSGKHEEAACAARWTHYGTSPPSSIGAGTIFFLAARAGWTRPARQETEAPPDMPDEWWENVEAGMSAEDWHDMEQRESGAAVPASDKARTAAGSDLLWSVTEAWDEAKIPPRPWVVKGYLLRGAVSVISGAPSAGKSSLMVAWTGALAVGCPYGRFKVPGPVRVMNYNVEDDADEQQRRFSALFRRLGVGPEHWQGRMQLVGPNRVGILLSAARDGSILVNTPVMDRLEKLVEEFKPDVLILDPFAELHGAEENDNTAIRGVMARFRAMAVEHKMAVAILHHSRKGGNTPGDPETLRGASAIVGAARVTVTVNTMSEDDAKELGISEKARRFYFRVDGAKANYAPLSEAEWYERVVYELENGDDAVVAAPWEPTVNEASGDVVKQALDAIARGSLHGPFSSRLSDDPRSFARIAETLAISSRADQRQLLLRLMRQCGVVECRFKLPRRSPENLPIGLRTADGAPHNYEWVEG